MAIDFTLEPWKRLPKLAPPGTTEEDLTAAAERWSTTTDLYAAAADLWEEAAMAIDLMPDATEQLPLEQREIRSISQDGISITYASDNLIGSGWTSRTATSSKMMDRARYFRKKAKAKSPLVHDPDYNPWKNSRRECDESIIVVNEVTEL